MKEMGLASVKTALTEWIGKADAARHLSYFSIRQVPIALAEISNRFDDYYISLVGELFVRLREPYESPDDWAKLGNALAQIGNDEQTTLARFGVNATEALFFAATAFYSGGFSASAYVTARRALPSARDFRYAPCLDLLTRTSNPASDVVRDLRRALFENNLAVVDGALSGRRKRLKLHSRSVQMSTSLSACCRHSFFVSARRISKPSYRAPVKAFGLPWFGPF
jgi:hypothetical protein